MSGAARCDLKDEHLKWYISNLATWRISAQIRSEPYPRVWNTGLCSHLLVVAGVDTLLGQIQGHALPISTSLHSTSSTAYLLSGMCPLNALCIPCDGWVVAN